MTRAAEVAGDPGAARRVEPRLSLVVASTGGAGPVGACLAELLGGGAPPRLEVVVAHAAAGAELAELAARWPAVRFVGLPAGAGVAEARRRGMAAASGDVVALAEAARAPVGGWAALVVRLGGAPAGVAASPTARPESDGVPCPGAPAGLPS
jgi:hypothetical protein